MIGGEIAYNLLRVSSDEMLEFKRSIPASAAPFVFCVVPGNLEVWPPLSGGWRLDWVDDSGERLVAINDGGG